MNAHHPPPDDVFVQRLREGFAPPASSPARDARFDQALRARLERRPKTWMMQALLTSGAVAAAATVVAVALSSGAPAPTTQVDWLSAALDEPLLEQPTHDLPEEYEALALLIDDDALLPLTQEPGDDQ